MKATGTAAFALLAAYLLTGKVALLRRLLIPSSLIGGFILLSLGPEAGGVLPAPLYATWRAWPGFLMTFLFVGIILGESGPAAAADANLAGDVLRQTLFVWFVGITELALGFLLTLTLLAAWDTPILFAHIIEIGWIGGHGAAGVFSNIAAELGQPIAGTMSVFSATVGLVVGGSLGLALVNRFRAARDQPEADAREVSPRSDVQRSQTDPNAAVGESPAGEAIFKAILLFLAIAFLAAMVREVAARAVGILGAASAVPLVKDFPLFSIALVVALVSRRPLQKAGLHSGTVAQACGFLTGVVLEFIILSATATLRLGSASQQLPAFALLMLAATGWTVTLLLFFAPRFLPRDCWKELGILNYGMSTGVTAVGLMLVRSLRGSVSARVARIYGMSAPFSAPLIGGGAISLLLPRLTVEGYGWGILLALVVAAALLWIASVMLNRNRHRTRS